MKVKIIPPQKQKVKIIPPDTMKYGGRQPGAGNEFSFDSRWNPDSYQGMFGVDPKPDPYTNVGRTLPEAKNGEGNVNAEKDEQVLGNFTPDGMPSLMGVNGPPHTEGGKDIQVPEGSFIFSDTPSLKIKDPEVLKQFNMSKSATPAKIAKQYNLQKFTKVIADPDADPVSKKTAELMVGNYTDKLNALASVQEGMKNKMGIGDNKQPQMPIAQLGGPQGKYDDVFDVNNYDAGNQSGNIPTSNTRKVRVHPPSQYPVGLGEQNQAWDWFRGINNQQLPVTDNSQAPNPPDQLPAMPEITPNSISNIGPGPSNPETRIGSYTATQTHVPFTSPTPDKLGLLNSMINSATIHRYPAYEAPIGAVAPNTVFEDPTRAIAAQQELANAHSYSNALSANSRAARAQSMSNQGVAGEQSANIVGATGNRNTQIANQASREAADISNRLQGEQAQRLNRLYQGDVTSHQQYDNALREGRNDITRQIQQGWKDRQAYDLINKTSPYFYIDPISGQRGFKSPEAKAHFDSEINRMSSGTGIAPGAISVYKVAYDEAIAKGINPTRADKYAAEKSGMTDREREKLNYAGVLQSETVSKSGVEKYGGKIKNHKFAGFSNHQLKKFVANSYSK